MEQIEIDRKMVFEFHNESTGDEAVEYHSKKQSTSN